MRGLIIIIVAPGNVCGRRVASGIGHVRQLRNGCGRCVGNAPSACQSVQFWSAERLRDPSLGDTGSTEIRREGQDQRASQRRGHEAQTAGRRNNRR